MLKRTVAAIMLVMLVVGTLALAFKIEIANAQGIIYIRADGSIDPSTVNISTSDGMVYTFSGDIINDSVVIERDNIVVDGAGFLLQGTNASEVSAIDLSGRSNVTVSNVVIRNFDRGILLNSSTSNFIRGNMFGGYEWNSIELISSSNNTISGNSMMTNGNFGVHLTNYSENNSITSNSINKQFGGIMLEVYSDHNVVFGNNLTNLWVGMYLSSADYNEIYENNITNGISNGNRYFGIELYSSQNNSILDNNLVGTGLYIWDSYYNRAENNSVNYKPLVYLEGALNHAISDAGQVVLVKCENITVEGLNLSRTSYSVELWETSNCTISGNSVTEDANVGIDLEYSSDYNSVSGNNVTGNWLGVSLSQYSNFNNIFGNNIMQNSNYGIMLYSAANNSITGNNFSRNEDFGIEIAYLSNYNVIFHNNFINNYLWQVDTAADCVNVWYDGYPFGGNYWSNYVGNDTCGGPYQNVTGRDGIGDTPYTIDSGNVDVYPLMKPWIRLAGDINGDGIVDIYDAILLAGAFNSRTGGGQNWNPNADINQDGIVDIYDAIILAGHYNQHNP